jgi:hypothetical protein
MSETPNYHAIIPAPVRYDNELSGDEKILYGEISALSNKEGFCWASNDYFAKLYQVHKTTISGWVNKLKSRGHVETVVDKLGNRKIYIVKPLAQTLRGISPTGNPPLSPTGNHNVLSINNIIKVSDETSTFEEELTTKGWKQDSSVDSDGSVFEWWVDETGRKVKPAEINRLRKEFAKRNHQPSELDRFADVIAAVMKKHHNTHPAIGPQEKKRIKDNLMSQMAKDELKSYAQWYFVDADIDLERRMNLYSFTDNYWINKFRSQNV